MLEIDSQFPAHILPVSMQNTVFLLVDREVAVCRVEIGAAVVAEWERGRECGGGEFGVECLDAVRVF